MQLLTFKKGVHPPSEKSWTENSPIRSIGDPPEIIVPLLQHIGTSNKALVKKKDAVRAGQVIGDAEAFVSCPVHSPISGTVKAVEGRPHPSGKSVESIIIAPDGKNEWVEGPSEEKALLDLTPDEIRAVIRKAGLAGMGGASFPTHVKLTPPKGLTVDAVILNAAECEPYLTADHRLMVEQPEQVLQGLKIFQKALGTRKAWVGIENNKPQAIEKMQRAAQSDGSGIEIKILEAKYPQGAEKMLIKAIMNKEVPSGKLPAHAGAIVQNVGTAVAAAKAIGKGLPLIERVVTVTGRGIREPANLLVKIGTPLRHCIESCGGFADNAQKIILGGPMMGIAVSDLDIPVMKGTSGILVLTAKEVENLKSRACIGCGRCVGACPMGLLPTRLARFSEHLLLEKAERVGLFDCIECGSCAYVCPAAIPLVQWIRHGKFKAMEAKKKPPVVAEK